jgi:membrane-associated phospholipid phosphatase
VVLTSLFFSHRTAFYPLLPYTALLVVPTVHGRYHYAVDPIAGVVIGSLAGLLVARAEAKWTRSAVEG